MAEKPILFSAPMVLAILEGRKTMTRRELKPQPVYAFDAIFLDDDSAWQTGDALSGQRFEKLPVKITKGDRLWVREAWRADSSHNRTKPSDLDENTVQISYEADGTTGQSGKLWPGIFMPRWASRITLEVTAVKVERLQDISEADAEAEGAGWWDAMHPCDGVAREPATSLPNAISGFKAVWTTINGPGAWDANPWVAAYSFKRVTT